MHTAEGHGGFSMSQAFVCRHDGQTKRVAGGGGALTAVPVAAGEGVLVSCIGCSAAFSHSLPPHSGHATSVILSATFEDRSLQGDTSMRNAIVMSIH